MENNLNSPTQEKQITISSILEDSKDDGLVTMNTDQENAFQMFIDFILDPSKKAMVITGDPGTGKSRMISHIYNSFPLVQSLLEVMGLKKFNDIYLTATTQQAAAVISTMTKADAQTIQSLLKLRVHTDYSGVRPKTQLITTKATMPIENSLVIIDEMSYEGVVLNGFIKSLLSKSKTVHIGDYNQILGVGEKIPAVQKEDYPTAVLSIIERRKEINGQIHPITQISNDLVKVINGGKWSPTKPDGHHLYLCKDQDEFEQLIRDEFSRPDWKASDSRIVCYTNDKVKAYNTSIKMYRTGDMFNVGDVLISNQMTILGNKKIPNNSYLIVRSIKPETKKIGPYPVRGWEIESEFGVGFLPAYSDEVNTVRKFAHNTNQIGLKAVIEENWLNVRHPYAMTADKSQGSTFNTVFIDLHDLSRITVKMDLVRRLNVAITRAKERVIFYGKIAI